MNKKITDAISDYLQLSMVNKAIGTYDFEKSKLNHFKNYITEEHGLIYMNEITIKVIIDYIFFLKKTCISNTINKHIKLLKLFYKTLNIEFQELQQIKNLKEIIKPVEIIDYDILKKLISYTMKLDSNIGNNLLYQTIFFLLVDTGARISEIMFIEKKHINLNKNEILLSHTKNKKQRKVFITDALSKKFIKEFIKRNYKTKYLLYDILKNKQASYSQIKYYIKTLKEEFDIPRIYPHLFRHTAATYWLENGADIYFVQKILGHEKIDMTMRYIHANTAYRKKVYDQVSITPDIKKGD